MIQTDDGIFFRQSWLSTAVTCPERGRRGIVQPEFDEKSGDAAAIGTGAHAGAETILLGGSVGDARDAITAAIAEDEAIGIDFKSYSTIDEVHAYANTCFDAWLAEIYPVLEYDGKLGGHPETKFREVLFHMPDGTPVGIEGTVDYPLPPPFNEIIDWKTSARPYKQKDKQKHAIQPTAYGWAAVRGALGHEHYQWPIRFTYGVMIRPSNPSKPARTEMVSVERNEHHARWVLRQMQIFLTLQLKAGLDTEWPMVPENNWLCSQKWCPWYGECRGANITWQDDTPITIIG